MANVPGDTPGVGAADDHTIASSYVGTVSPDDGTDLSHVGTVVADSEPRDASKSAATHVPPSHGAAEPPKWRFVSAAKKSLGYSSLAAGSYIRGKTADELAAKYVAPQDSGSLHESEAGGVQVGKVAVPGAFEGGEHELERPTMKLKGAPEDDDGTIVSYMGTIVADDGTVVQPPGDLPLPGSPEALKMQTDIVRMQQESLKLRVEILEAEGKKQELEQATASLQKGKKSMLPMRRQSTDRAAAAAQKMQSIGDVENGVDKAVVPVPLENGDAEISTDDKQQRNKTRCLYGTILLLIVVIAVILGVWLGGSSGESNEGDASNLEGGDNVGSGTPSPAVTSPARPYDPLAPPITEPDDFLGCPLDTRRFDLAFDVGPDPSHINWLVLDACTLDVFYRCPRCYMEFPPDQPVQFSACLPILNDETGVPMEYTLQMMDLSGPPSFGYELRYDGEVVVDQREGFEDSAMFHHFGYPSACSEMPSASPSPTESPTKQPVTPQPTIDIAIEAVPGCTPFIETTNACGRVPDVEDELLLPRGQGSLDNQLFGSSVTFVGNSGEYVAVGSGVLDGPVHIYRRVPGPLGDGGYMWQYTASVASNENSGAEFGFSLASNDEGYLAVGAPVTSPGASGKVYLYRPNAQFTQWNLVATLTGDNSERAPMFGSSVAFDGTLIAVGSASENGGQGAVYVFERTGELGQEGQWTPSAKLLPAGLANGASFGLSVSLFGDSPATLAVGAPGDAGGGSAFVYVRDDFGWEAQKLIPRDIQDGDSFGGQVDISGCTVAVSSVGDATISATGTGTVRTFDLDPRSNTWEHSQIIEPNDNLAGDIFGHCIDIEGNTMLVGAPWGGEGDDGTEAGVIYHYERIGGLWSKISVTQNLDYLPGEDTDFGCPIALQGDRIVVGSTADSTLGPFSGAAYIYDLCPNIEPAL
ncbi:hypothetical protein ACHAXT_012883 [Thalassiosira profunda]